MGAAFALAGGGATEDASSVGTSVESGAAVIPPKSSESWCSADQGLPHKSGLATLILLKINPRSIYCRLKNTLTWADGHTVSAKVPYSPGSGVGQMDAVLT